MAHARQQIREAVGTLLRANPANWGAVFETRIIPSRDIPKYLLVFVDNEIVTTETIHSTAPQMRDISVTILGHTRIVDGNDDYEDWLDAVGAEIESTLTHSALNTALSNKATSSGLVSSEFSIVEDDENNRTYAEIALNWRVRVMTLEGDSETLI